MPPVLDGVSDAEGNVPALVQSFAMIIFSEIGDKTFLIAAILAMRHPRLVVFAGALGSLVVMSILSAAMGHILPTLIPKRWTQMAAAVLFLVFGSKMLLEARGMKGGKEKIREEMKEAEEEVEEDEMGEEKGEVIGMQSTETVNEIAVADVEKAAGKTKPVSFKEGLRNFCSLFFGPVFVQAFVLTFLGEWGDRSQIATIALGAAHTVFLVSLGTVVGHACCTGLAVIGGRYISTKISIKQVTFGGSALFLLFGVIYLYEAWAMTSEIEMAISLTAEKT